MNFSLFGKAISLLNPLFLLGIPACAIVLYFFTKKQTRIKEVIVATNFIIEKVKASVQPKKFKIPLKLILQTLLLSLLFIALTKPTIIVEPNKESYIIDNSLSMTYQVNNKSLFDIGIEISNQVKKDNSSTHPLLGNNLSISLVNDSAKKELSQFENILNKDQPDLLTYITDKKIINDGEFEESIFDYNNVKVRKYTLYESRNYKLKKPFRLFAIDRGYGKGNLTIKDAKINQFSQEISISILKSNLLEERAKLIVIPIDYTGTKIYFDYENPVYSEILEFNNTKEINTSFELKKYNERFVLITVGSDLQSDQLKYDNSIILDLKNSLKTISYNGPLSLRQSKLNNVKGFRTINNSQNSDLLIVHRREVNDFKHNNILAINPLKIGKAKLYKRVNNLKQSSSTLKNITTWEPGHPFVRYLKPFQLKLNEFIYSKPPYYADAVIKSGEKIVSWTGENKGKTLTFAGFELLPYEGKKDKVSSILLLNMINSLVAKKKPIFKKITEISNFINRGKNQYKAMISNLGKEGVDIYDIEYHKINKSIISNGSELHPLNFINTEESNFESPKTIRTSKIKTLFSKNETANNKLNISIEIYGISFLLLLTLFLVFLEARKND